jgi:hypothetical protein
MAPLGGVERPRRVVRFAQLIHRRGRAFGPAFGLRRLRRHSEPDVLATQGDAAGAHSVLTLPQRTSVAGRARRSLEISVDVSSGVDPTTAPSIG